MGMTKKINRQSNGKIVSKEMLDKAALYRQMNTNYRQLERDMKRLRAELEEYMDSKGLDFIFDDNGLGVAREVREMTEITARYTTYDVDDLIVGVDNPEVIADCIVEVVDRDLVQAKILTGELPKEVQELKRSKPTICFVTK